MVGFEFGFEVELDEDWKEGVGGEEKEGVGGEKEGVGGEDWKEGVGGEE